MLKTENSSDNYWEHFFSTRQGWGAYPSEELVRFMARNFGSVERGDVRVLEVGCGPGPNLWYLLREGYRVAGIDCSSTALALAHARMKAESLSAASERLDLRVGDFAVLPWADFSFDAVVEVSALYANKIEGIRRAINEIHRCLKPGGLFFGKLFGEQTTGSDSGICIEPGTRQSPDRGPCAGNEVAHFFSQNELNELFGEFSQVDIDYVLRTDKSGAIKIHHWLVIARK